MRIEVRPAEASDAEAVAEILNAAIRDGGATVFDTPLTAREERRYIESFPERGVFHVAEASDNGRAVVGFQSMEPFASYTHAFDHVGVLGTYVHENHRRRGVATALFRATFQAAVGKGYEKIFTYIRADNPAALCTYLKQGFQILGTARRHAKIQGRYVDEIIVERFLA